MSSSERYRIGAVSRLTGLPVATIRSWERRHSAVSPERGDLANNRRYSDRDVERLRTLRALVKHGESISEIAALSEHALRLRLERHAGPIAREDAPPRVALFHAGLGPLIERHKFTGERWEIVAAAADLPSLRKALPRDRPDVLIADADLMGPPLDQHYEDLVKAIAPRLTVVVYEFAPRRVLERLQGRGARLVRGPTDLPTLEPIVAEALGRVAPSQASPRRSEPAPSPRYSVAQLAQLRALLPTLECECPNHLAGLIESLSAFERYSANCESRSEEERELHRTLREETGRARSIMEAMLDLVCRYDGIEIGP